MFKLLKSETNPLTPEMLAWFQELPSSPLERDLKQTRINFLRDKVELGYIVPFHWVTARINGELLRINGQHSSRMLSDLPSLDQNWKVHYDEYEVQCPEDFALIFRQIDARQSGRSPLDISGAYQGMQSELAGISKTDAKLGAEGVAWWGHHVQGDMRNLKGDDRYTLFNREEFHDFFRWVGKLVSGDTPTPELRNPAVVAAMYGCSLKDNNETADFWGNIANGGTGLDEDDPAPVLYEWLRAAISKDPERDIKLKPSNFWNGCIYAWNAYRQGKKIGSIPGTAKGYGDAKGLHEPL